MVENTIHATQAVVTLDVPIQGIVWGSIITVNMWAKSPEMVSSTQAKAKQQEHKYFKKIAQYCKHVSKKPGNGGLHLSERQAKRTAIFLKMTQLKFH